MVATRGHRAVTTTLIGSIEFDFSILASVLLLANDFMCFAANRDQLGFQNHCINITSVANVGSPGNIAPLRGKQAKEMQNRVRSGRTSLIADSLV